MKKSVPVILVYMVSLLFGCKKSNEPNKTISPVTNTSDTSVKLISNPRIVGNWNIVTDTVYLQGTSFYPGGSAMYYGTAADHYIFTKYGNLYIKSAFNNYTDTAVYTISGTDTLRWISSYVSQAGAVTTSPVTAGIFIISSPEPTSLVLTQGGYIPEGWRYEQIKFRKQ